MRRWAEAFSGLGPVGWAFLMGLRLKAWGFGAQDTISYYHVRWPEIKNRSKDSGGRQLWHAELGV